MDDIFRFFRNNKKKKEIIDFDDVDIEEEQDLLELHEQKFINGVIKLLIERPNDFTSKSYYSTRINSTVDNKLKNITIGIKSGRIISPIEPKMTDEQKEKIKKLIRPIVERDSNDILVDLFGENYMDDL